MVDRLKIDVIILSWNRKDDLKETILELKRQTWKDFQLVVVDNNSEDGSQQMIQDQFPWIRLIKLPFNYGVPGGRNVGILNSEGDILFFLDNDAVIEKDGLRKIVTAFESDPEIGIINCKLIDYYSRELDSWPFPQGRDLQDKKFFTNTFQGGCSAVRREVFEKAGLFDDRLFFMHEEIDFSYRVIDNGYKIQYNPGIRVLHKYSQESSYRGGRNLYYDLRNRLYIAWKYLPFLKAIRLTLVRTIASFVKCSRRRQPHQFLKAIFGLLLLVPEILKKRNRISAVGLREMKNLHGNKDTVFWGLRKMINRDS